MLGLFVYIFLFSLTILFSRQYALAEESNDTKKQIWAFAMIMLVFSLIVGLRWEVGIDYSAYYDLLVGDVSYWAYDRLEPISRWSILFVQKSQLPFYTWFIFVAFTQIFFLVKSFRGKYAYLLPLGIFCFLAYTLSFNMNVARQGCALSIALYAYSFIYQKDWKRFVLFVLLAACFHKTAIVILPLYFVGRITKILPTNIQLILFGAFIVGGSLVVDFLIAKTGVYWDILGFRHKVDQLAEHQWEIQAGAGLGVFFTQFRRAAIIFFSKQMCDYYDDQHFKSFYNIFFIGICLYTATMNDMLLERLFRYLSICDIVISAYFFNYIIKVNKGYQMLAYILLLGIAVLTTYDVIVSEWQFVSIF